MLIRINIFVCKLHFSQKCFAGGNNFFHLCAIICTHGVLTNQNVIFLCNFDSYYL